MVLAIVDQAGKLVTLKRVGLGNKILENAWYRLSVAGASSGRHPPSPASRSRARSRPRVWCGATHEKPMGRA